MMGSPKVNADPGSRGNPGKEKRYSVQDLITANDIGRACTITMVNGRSESGKLNRVSQFEIELKMSNGKDLIVMKHALVTVSFT